VKSLSDSIRQPQSAARVGKASLYLIFAVTAVIAIGASFRSNLDVAFSFLCFFVVSLFCIRLSGNDIVSPPAMLFIVGVVCFTLPFAYLINGGSYTKHFSGSSYSKAYAVFVFGFLSFLIAYQANIMRLVSPTLIVGRKISHPKPNYVVNTAVTSSALIVFYAIRIKYSIGLPGKLPGHVFAGIIYYLSTTFVVMYCVHNFITSLFTPSTAREKTIAVIPIFLYAIYQASLGWRGGTIVAFFLIPVLIWYRHVFHDLKFRIHHLGLFVLIVLFVYAVISLGAMRRGTSMTESAFSVSPSEIILEYRVSFLRIWQRFWGISFLETVTSFIDKNILTNNWLILDLMQDNMSANMYHNKVIIGDSLQKIHGNAATCTGSFLIMAGLVGVFMGNFIIGNVMRYLYDCLMNSKTDRVYSLLLYSSSILFFFSTIIAGFSLGTLKELFIIVTYVLMVRFAKAFLNRCRLVGSRIGGSGRGRIRVFCDTSGCGTRSVGLVAEK